MKSISKVGVIIAGSILVGTAFSAANAAEVLRLNFDGDPVTDAAVYTVGPGDNVAAASLVQSFPWPGGVTQPELLGFSITDDPPAGGFQGGNALELNTAANETRKGLYVVLDEPITGPFTIEGIFYQETLDSADDRMEFELQSWLQAWFLGDTEARFELRTFGPVLSPNNTINFITLDGGEVESGVNAGVNGAPAVQTWHHVAIVNDGAGEVRIYVSDSGVPDASATPLLTHSENWAAPKGLGNLIIGAWANDAGSARDFIGFIDAISISDEALAPADFRLLQEDTSVQEWILY